MKITTKTTKEQLKNFLGANVKAVKEQDKDLYDKIAYADKMMKTDDSKVSRTDLISLAKSIIKLLGDKVTEPTETTSEQATAEPTAENSVKFNKKKADSKTGEKAEKTAKKSSKKDNDTVLEDEIVQADIFPQTLELEDGSKYELLANIQNMEDLLKVSQEETIVFAFHWTKRDLKKFPYFGNVLGKYESFEKDFDLASCFYVSDNETVAYGLSMYTEAFYTVLPDDLEELDGVRYASGIEYQIYKAV